MTGSPVAVLQPLLAAASPDGDDGANGSRAAALAAAEEAVAIGSGIEDAALAAVVVSALRAWSNYEGALLGATSAAAPHIEDVVAPFAEGDGATFYLRASAAAAIADAGLPRFHRRGSVGILCLDVLVGKLTAALAGRHRPSALSPEAWAWLREFFSQLESGGGELKGDLATLLVVSNGPLVPIHSSSVHSVVGSNNGGGASTAAAVGAAAVAHWTAAAATSGSAFSGCRGDGAATSQSGDSRASCGDLGAKLIPSTSLPLGSSGVAGASNTSGSSGSNKSGDRGYGPGSGAKGNGDGSSSGLASLAKGGRPSGRPVGLTIETLAARDASKKGASISTGSASGATSFPPLSTAAGGLQQGQKVGGARSSTSGLTSCPFAEFSPDDAYQLLNMLCQWRSGGSDSTAAAAAAARSSLLESVSSSGRHGAAGGGLVAKICRQVCLVCTQSGSPAAAEARGNILTYVKDLRTGLVLKQWCIGVRPSSCKSSSGTSSNSRSDAAAALAPNSAAAPLDARAPGPDSAPADDAQRISKRPIGGDAEAMTRRLVLSGMVGASFCYTHYPQSVMAAETASTMVTPTGSTESPGGLAATGSHRQQQGSSNS
ncbi:unnamed protein product, partial [Phaeothamnion confervicola]